MKLKKTGSLITWAAAVLAVVTLCNFPLRADTREEYTNDFVERMYSEVLGRGSDPSGKQYWVTNILTGRTTGASCAYGFFESEEYRVCGVSDEQYVRTLYSVMLGREADAAGLSYWMGLLAGGTPRSYVLAGFVNSNEYDRICSSYSIERGSLPMDPGLVRTGTAGQLVLEGDDLYFCDLAGQRLTGWQRVNGSRYYFDPADSGRAASGWHYIDGLNYYFDEEHRLVQNVDSILGRRNSYYITVNTATQTVMIYARDDSGAYNIPVRAMTCSTGKPGRGTIQGTYEVRRGNEWGALFNDGSTVWGRYISIISGNYLFHSCWYYTNGDLNSLSVSEYNKLGTPASHGCVRLCAADARWIWENCAGCSNVRIFSSNEEAPFDRPEAVPAAGTHGDRGTDPTG